MRGTVILLGGLLAGCSANGGGPDTRPLQADLDGALAETVNGTPVPRELLEAVARARDLDLSRPEQREQALKLLTDYVLLAQAAQQNNFFAQPQFRADVEAARLQGLGNATLGLLQQQAPVTDAVVRAEFESQLAQAGKFEFDFTQMLFDNADDALKAEGDIASGKPFDQVYDTWHEKAKQAKSFTHVRKDQVPDELAKALAELKNGESTKTAVKTDFGWHVVHLVSANPFTPPPFEQVKDSVRQTLLLQVGRERLQKLKEQAKIEYPPGSAPPASKRADAKPTTTDNAVEKAIDAAKRH